MQIAHGSKTYTVDCPQLLYPLIETHGVQLLHPVDCLRLGVFGSGYFISDVSVSVHGGGGRFTAADS